jgi:NTP pyrophosphatase (non-canonical NTP hydrolase)
MDLSKYQRECRKTDQTKGRDEIGLTVALLGLAGEAGSLLSEYKKHLRDGPTYKVFEERVAEELGDLLWYVASLSSRANLDLSDVALKNLEKARNRWQVRASEGTLGQPKLFDDAFPSKEQLPRNFRLIFRQERLRSKKREFGNPAAGPNSLK